MHFIGILYGHTERYRRIRFERTVPQKLARDVEAEHRALMDAVLARDTRRAQRLLTEHLEKTGVFIADELSAPRAIATTVSPSKRKRGKAKAA